MSDEILPPTVIGVKVEEPRARITLAQPVDPGAVLLKHILLNSLFTNLKSML
jgi:hypothetical protein